MPLAGSVKLETSVFRQTDGAAASAVFKACKFPPPFVTALRFIPHRKTCPFTGLIGQPSAVAVAADWFTISSINRYVCVSTFVAFHPGLYANARTAFVL